MSWREEMRAEGAIKKNILIWSLIPMVKVDVYVH